MFEAGCDEINHGEPLGSREFMYAAALIAANMVRAMRQNACEECSQALLLEYDGWHAEAVAKALQAPAGVPQCSPLAGE